MRVKMFMLCLLSIFILSVLDPVIASAEWIPYSFKNYSGRTIKNLYISHSGYGEWGDDTLEEDVLKHGGSVECEYDDEFRYFDIKIVWMDGSSTVWDKYDFHDMWRLTLYDSGSGYIIDPN